MFERRELCIVYLLTEAKCQRNDFQTDGNYSYLFIIIIYHIYIYHIYYSS